MSTRGILRAVDCSSICYPDSSKNSFAVSRAEVENQGCIGRGLQAPLPQCPLALGHGPTFVLGSSKDEGGLTALALRMDGDIRARSSPVPTQPKSQSSTNPSRRSSPTNSAARFKCDQKLQPSREPLCSRQERTKDRNGGLAQGECSPAFRKMIDTTRPRIEVRR